MLCEDVYPGVLACIIGIGDVQYVQMDFSLLIQRGVAVTTLVSYKIDGSVVGISSGNAVALALRLKARSNDVIFGQIPKYPR